MSARVRRNLVVLKQLYKARPASRRVILKNASADFLDTICEISLNILNGKIPLTRKQYTQLKKRKTQLRTLASRCTSIYRKKQVVNQSGGAFFLPAIAAAIPFLASLFTRG